MFFHFPMYTKYKKIHQNSAKCETYTFSMWYCQINLWYFAGKTEDSGFGTKFLFWDIFMCERIFWDYFSSFDKKMSSLKLLSRFVASLFSSLSSFVRKIIWDIWGKFKREFKFQRWQKGFARVLNSFFLFN